ncbi:MAG TPA: hypothetical protein VGJ86_02675, partial [Acidimicrobiales bacterium]
MLIASIVSRNYLHMVRVLARSFLAHHPDGRVVVLVIDAPGEGVRPDEPFEVVTLDQLPIGPREARRLATIYTVVELATALKPYFLRYLIVDRGEPSATYLDPDIQVFAPLDDLDAAARQHGLVLTPHRLAPLAPGVPPVEFVLSRSGSYNLGFASVSGDAVPFLDWWAERCRRDCIDDIPAGYFVDQRWVDLATTYYAHYVERDPGCNVAYWNLDHRPLTFVRDGDPDAGFLAGGAQLRFFHFSGYDPDVPHMLTPYQGARPWILLSEDPVLRVLCSRYGAALEEAGRAESSKLAYGWGVAANGMPLDRVMRRVVRQEVMLREEGVRPDLGPVDELPDPFEPGEADRFVDLLRSPFPESSAPRISRYLHGVYRDRPSLQSAFPGLLGAGGNHFLWWVREMGHEELGVPSELVPTAADLDPVAEAADSVEETRGVCLVGYLHAELGMGEHARSTAETLSAIGEPFGAVADPDIRSRQQAGRTSRLTEIDGDINLLCVNADRVQLTLDRLGPAFPRNRYTIGHWAWEIEDFTPDRTEAARLLDEVWAVSAHAARAIGDAVEGAGIDTPVHVVPPAVIEHQPSSKAMRAELDIPDGFMFLFCFDFFSVAERKNPHGVVEAFCRAFPSGTGPQLVLKSINGSVVVSELERLKLRALDRPDIHIRDGYLDHADQLALVAAGDAYVSLHRAEGFGYTMAEAMLRAKPVIATGYSGNLEFMDEHNSFLVGHELVTIPPGCAPYPAGSRWADPDLDQAAEFMRQVVSDPSGTAAVAERGRRTILEGHTPAARGPLLAERLASARARRGPSAAVVVPPLARPSPSL